VNSLKTGRTGANADRAGEEPLVLVALVLIIVAPLVAALYWIVG
jgi:hypothetical protein